MILLSYYYKTQITTIDYYEQLYVKKSEKPKGVNTFLDSYNLLTLNYEEMEIDTLFPPFLFNMTFEGKRRNKRYSN
jgi:hypothetical protein